MKKITKIGRSFFPLFLIVLLLAFLSGYDSFTPSTYGTIDITSTPPGAKLYLDGEDTGYVTPAVLPDISAGTHTLLLTKYLYNNWESTIDLAAGQTYIIAVDLEEAAIEEMSIREGIDAGVETFFPDNNYSDLEFLAVGDSAIDYNTMRTFIKFDLGSIPEGAIITKALINLYYFDDYGSGDIDIDLHEVSEDWQENQITWNTMPDYETTKVADFHCNVSNLNSFLGDEITTLCRLWVEQSKPNYGLMLKVRDENTIAYAPKFYSLEYPDVTKRPLLRIDYYIP
jgi:hypothetical protein